MILKLEDQVSSLESSMELKRLGCSQSSLFYWEKSPYSNEYSIFMRNTGDIYMQDWCSAYTASELGEILSLASFAMDMSPFKINSSEKSWLMSHGMIEGKRKVISADTEVEARAKMLCYLLENKLIEVPK